MNYNQSLQSTLIYTLDQSLLLAQDWLTEFIDDTDFQRKIALTFGATVNFTEAKSLLKQLTEANSPGLPRFEIRSESEINGARGAFAATNNTIYLSQAFLAENTHNLPVIATVIVEELGHWLDARLNVADTQGDEGELFSDLVRGVVVSEGELQRINGEDDSAVITIDGQMLQIEQALLPDLFGIDFNVTPEPLTAGDRFTVEYQIRNSGGNPFNSFDVDFYLSTNDTISRADHLLGSRTISGLRGNSDTPTFTASLSLPDSSDSFWSGDKRYYIGMIVDANDDILESNESNNRNQGSLVDYDGVNISIPSLPDLFSARFDVTPEPLTAGSLVYIKYQIGNSGGSTSDDIKLSFFLSTNNIITSSDYKIASDTLPRLEGNSTTFVNTMITTLPDADDPFWQGNTTYYIGMVINSGEPFSIINGANNTDYDSVQIDINIFEEDIYESNNSFSVATNLTNLSGLRQEDNLSIHNNVDQDWFKFQITEQTTAENYLSIAFDREGDLDIALYDIQNQLIDYSFGSGNSKTISLAGLTPGYYYLQVYGSLASTNDYSLIINAPGVNSSISDDEFETNKITLNDNNTKLTATILKDQGWSQQFGLKSWENLSIGSNDQDWFQFDLKQQGISGNFVGITFDTYQGDLDLELYNSEGIKTKSAEGFRDIESVSLEGLAIGTYYARVIGYSGNTNPNYTLFIKTPGSDRFEENDTKDQAPTLERTNVLQTWDNLSIDNEDWFKITLPSGVTSNDYISISFDHSQGDIDLELYDSTGTTKLLDSTGVGNSESISLAGLSGDYYIKVFGYNNANNPNYSLTINAPISNTGDWLEANNTQATATDLNTQFSQQLEAGVTFIQLGDSSNKPLSIHNASDVDWFKFTITSEGKLGDYASISFNHTAGDLDLELYNNSGQLLKSSNGIANSHAIDLKGLAAGTYALKVLGYGGSTNSAYSLAIQAPFVEKTGDWSESNNTSATAKDLGTIIDSYSKGNLSIHNTTDVDWFKFTLGAKGGIEDNISINFNHGQGDLDIELYRADGVTLVGDSTGVTDIEEISLNNLAAGTYLLKVFGYNGAANPDYSLFIEAPENVSGDWAEQGTANNSVANARDLRNVEGLQTWQTLSIHNTSDVDWFKFTTIGTSDANDVVQIAFDQSLGDLELYLYNSTGTTILKKSETINNIEEVSLSGLAAGTYLIQVKGYNGAINPSYQLAINAPETSTIPTDWADKNGTNNTRATAEDLLKLDGVNLFSGLSIHQGGDEDWFKFETLKTGIVGNAVSINFDREKGDLKLELYNSAGTLLTTSNENSNRELISLAGRSAGVYFVRVLGNTTSVTNPNYSLVIDAPQTLEKDWIDKGTTPNNSRANAYDLRSINGSVILSDLSIDTATDQDWFKVVVKQRTNSNQFARIDFNNDEGNLKLELISTSGAVLATSETTENFEQISLAGRDAGTYYVKVSGVANPNYTLTVNGIPDTVADGLEGATNAPKDAYQLRDLAISGGRGYEDVIRSQKQYRENIEFDTYQNTLRNIAREEAELSKKRKELDSSPQTQPSQVITPQRDKLLVDVTNDNFLSVAQWGLDHGFDIEWYNPRKSLVNQSSAPLQASGNSSSNSSSSSLFSGTSPRRSNSTRQNNSTVNDPFEGLFLDASPRQNNSTVNDPFEGLFLDDSPIETTENDPLEGLFIDWGGRASSSENFSVISNLSINTATDQDWFKFTLPAEGEDGQYVGLNFDNDLGNLQLELFEAFNTTTNTTEAQYLIYLVDRANGNGDSEQINLAGLAKGDYLVRVSGVNSATNPNYNLIFNAPPALETTGDWAEKGTTTNDTSSLAYDLKTIEGGINLSGLTIHTTTDRDWFQFKTTSAGTEGHRIRIDFAHNLGDLDLILYNQDGTTVRGRSETTENFEEINLNGVAAGTYKIQVLGYKGATNPNYSLSVFAPNGTTTPIEPDNLEPNNSFTTATNLDQVNKLSGISGQTIHSGDSDFFKFTTTKTGTASNFLSIGFEHAQGDLQLELYRQGSTTTPLRFSRGTTDNETITLDGLTAGTYYAKVFGNGATVANGYQLYIDAPTEAVQTRDEWTIFVYMTGSDLAQSAFNDINEMELAAASLPSNVNIVVLWDQSSLSTTYATGTNSAWGDTGWAVIRPDTDKDRVATTFTLLGERNTGDPNTLVEFLNIAKTAAPANKYGLILWNHGNGELGGFNVDNEGTSANTGADRLYSNELNTALQNVKNADPGFSLKLLAFDACLMAMAEVAYMVRNHAEIFVASQEAAEDTGYDYTTAFAALIDNPGEVKAIDLANSLIASYQQQHQGDRRGWDTLSATSTAALNTLVTSIKTFTDAAVALTSNATWDAIKDARDFANSFYPAPYYRDLGQFLQAVATSTNSNLPANLKTAANNALTALRNLVVDKTADQRNVQGLSVYFPNSGAIDAGYLSRNSQFLNATGWTNFLNAFTTRGSSTRNPLLQDWAEGNDVAARAFNLNTLTGSGHRFTNLSLPNAADQDYYRFSLSQAGGTGNTLTVSFTPQTGQSLAVSLFDPDNRTTALKTATASNGQASFNLSGLAANKEYLLLVNSPTTTGQPIPNYTLAINAPGAVQNSNDWARGNNTAAKAVDLGTIIQNNWFTGLQVDPATPDWFKFNLPKVSQLVPLSVTVHIAGNATATAQLFDPSNLNTPLATQTGAGSLQLTTPTPEPGKVYQLRVSQPSGQPAIAYSIAIEPVLVALPTGTTLAISATNASQTEGNSGSKAFTFTVARSGAATGTNNVNWAVTGSGSNPANATDFVGSVLPSGTVSFAAGETSKVITVNVQGDTTVEPNENFTVTLSTPTNGATITTATATGAIQNDDTSVTLAVSPASVTEDGTSNLVYTFTRSGVTTSALTVNYSIGGTATLNTDYTRSGTNNPHSAP
ncbi:MAG: hypothetical protein EWV53_14205 [Microcystis panniformis Mp_MB_F_20051200_S9]|uniref:Calx-beta domain-containing protein n=1 Tax=Microcystis panniformis Mp_MB_F_20051200_S9 TaxID=2486223 RepID=A0A552PUH5_9CHRO|nr:MAG: hypothetical protein EWV43_05515 [Microcystis panniformis Mp_MB_F_20080800_S26D]TRV60624.1 MAG: hypothetical protein EWV53_14205 [Microcystis panniformis Mp_MB_F_20051200_S9]TRV65657.1 MAG: hypothetical protein EWV86_08575 [Microcystis panniformis Mp_MB_F_20051200_S9D]TRV71239.1 MAG: hypothetical protein EWV52_14015 [Microcystis panniformis Mp_MB_F_20051200_S6D]